MGTDHHNVGLAVKSVLDAMDAVHGHLEPEMDCASASLGPDDTEATGAEEEEEEQVGGVGVCSLGILFGCWVVWVMGGS